MKKSQFFNQKIAYGRMREDFIDTLRKRDAKEVQHVIQTADSALAHEFLFDMEWDMERTYEPVKFGSVIDWEFQPADDPEFVWQFNRHRFLVCLGQAYQYTGDKKYVNGLIDLLMQFIHSQKRSRKNRSTTWRILEIGIRSSNWIRALYLIQDCDELTEEILEEVYTSMKDHAETIMREHYPYCYAGNWGILENHGLFLLGAMLHPCMETQTYVKQAVQVLDTALQMQVMPDGMQLEQSCMYHNEILRCMLEVMWYAEKTEMILPERMVQNIYHMAEVSRNFMKPNGHQFTMGDSDDMDVRPIMEMAACIFQERKFRKMGNLELSYESLWLLGEEGDKLYQSIQSTALNAASACLYDSGHVFFRSSWERNADVFHFDSGLLGTSHGHSDALHVDWIVDGEDVLIDPGRYTYVDRPERYEFRETQAHNTIQVDSQNFCLWENSWVSKTVMAQTHPTLIHREDMNFAQGSHTGYMSLDNPVLINRKVMQISEEIYVIVDECYTSGSHTYRQCFHFDSRGVVYQEKNHILFEHGKVRASLFLDSDGSAQLFPTRQSYHYNEAVENMSAECVKHGVGFESFVTVCVKGDGSHTKVSRLPVRSSNNQIIFPKEIAEGLKIVSGDQTFLLILAHTEMPGPVDLFQIEDCRGCGNVIVFDGRKDSYSGVVLNW